MTAHPPFDVGVIGLGFVGLTLATAFAQSGLRVAGIERRPEVVDLTRRGIPHFAETGLPEALSGVVADGRLEAFATLPPDRPCATYVITVGTPLDDAGAVRIDMIEDAARAVAAHMEDDALVLLRSTVKVGTARDVVAPILAASGKRFELAMCPERTLEGRAMQELRSLPQIVGADSPATRDRAAALFRRMTETVVAVSSLEAAEIAKLVSNTFRDLQFAFANEVARICDAYAVDGHEVIAAGNHKYTRTNIPRPGLVGGPCLEKDAHILAQSAAVRGIRLEIAEAARLVNERQPAETVAFIAAEATRRGLPADAPVAVLGLAFKGVPETDDLRGSMALKVLSALRAARPDAPIRLYDPVIAPHALAVQVPGHRVAASLRRATEGAAIVVIANNHPDLRAGGFASLAGGMYPGGFVYDYWNHFGAEVAHDYFPVGSAAARAAQADERHAPFGQAARAS